MSKVTVQHKKNRTEHEIILIKKLYDSVNILDDFLINIVKNGFSIIQTAIVNKIIIKAGSDARLGSCDEKIYESVKNLMEYYKEAVSLYEEKQHYVTGRKAREILAGLNSILTSRILAFNESVLNTIENPITVEKQQIINKGISYFEKNFNSLYEQFKVRGLKECVLKANALLINKTDYDGAISAINCCFNIMEQNIFNNFYKFYNDTVKYCCLNINSLETRKITSFYYELLKNEYGIISSIITIQGKVLEYETNNSQNLLEKHFANEILDKMREGYQHFIKQYAEIADALKETESVNLVVDSFEDFKNQCMENVKGENLLSAVIFDSTLLNYNDKIQIFKELLAKVIAQYIRNGIDSLNINKNFYQQRKVIAENMYLANELIEEFKKIIDYYDQNQEKLTNINDPSIINGIYETIQIKVESIEENKNYFEANMKQTMESFQEKLDSTKLKEIDSEVVEHIFKLLIDEVSKTENIKKQQVKAILEEVYKFEGYTTYANKIKKLLAEQNDKFNKSIFNYKREYLIFEISTYEEIINYSVSKLKDYEDEAAKEFASFADYISEQLTIIMKKNNIVLIRPLAHEMFNGKEHEVLMAEKNDDFKKGEIIKIINSGYKQNETVLIRANVIAAK